jgi:hypothetical protein
MPALVAGIHVFTALRRGTDVDGRNKSGHDVERLKLKFLDHMRLPCPRAGEGV